jgi:hypothetical protein
MSRYLKALLLAALVAWAPLEPSIAAVAITDLGTANLTGTSISITVPGGGVPAGATLVACIRDNGSSGVIGTMSDSASNSYAKGPNGSQNNAGIIGGALFYAYNVAALTSGQSITYTTTGASDALRLVAFYVTGLLERSSPLDSAVSNSTFGTSATPSVASGAPSISGELFVACVVTNSTSFTQDSTDAAWATPPDTQTSLDGGSVINSGTGALTYAPSTANAPWLELIAAFKPQKTPMVFVPSALP